MPIHIYTCKVCGKQREIYFSMSKDVKDELPCTMCRGTCVKMMSTQAKVELHGKGFHVNDYPKS